MGLRKKPLTKPRLRKVTAKEFFIHNFKKDPAYWAEKAYFNEWKARFKTGNPERYMGLKAEKVYRKLQKKKLPLPVGYKGKGGSSVRLVRIR